jgi:signal peptidase I
MKVLLKKYLWGRFWHMAKRDLYKLKKTELLQIIYEQKKEINNLKDENFALTQEIENRSIDIKEAGSIAEACLKINKIFEDAQKAADEYLNNVKKLDNSKKLTKLKISQDVGDCKKEEKCMELITLNMWLINTKKSFFRIIELFILKLFGKLKNLELSLEKHKILKNIKKIGKKEIEKLKRKERKEELARKISTFFNNIKSKINSFKKNLIFKKNELKEKYRTILKNAREKCKKIVQNTKDKRKVKFKKEKNKIQFNKVKEKDKIQFEKNEHAERKNFLTAKRKINLNDYDLSVENIENELKKQKNKESKVKFAQTSTYYIIIIIAVTIIIATRIFNIIQISGNSMQPTLTSGDFLISTKIFGYEKGDIVAFYYNNNILIKRVIATGGDIVNIDDDGNVYVNSKKIEENYVQNLSYGNCDIKFPFKVPDKEIFVLGDNRENSIDSRNKAIGSVSDDKILGKITINLNHLMIY